MKTRGQSTKRHRNNNNNNNNAERKRAKMAAAVAKAMAELGPAAYARPVNYLKPIEELKRVRELLEQPGLNADTRDLLESYKADLERKMTITNLLGGATKRRTRRARPSQKTP